jgi:diguanylate cyclase (GGDEF)-like protein
VADALRRLLLLAVPAALLAAAFGALVLGPPLPPSLSGLRTYGPYLLFAAGAALAAGFGRGRALLALVVLIAAYACQQAWLQQGPVGPQARAVYVALLVFVPLDLALLAWLPERGVFNRHGALRAAALAAQAAFTAWAAGPAGAGVVAAAYEPLLAAAGLGATRMPHLGIAAIGAGLLAAVAACLVLRSALAAAFAGAIAAFAVAAHVVSANATFSVFLSAALAMVAVGVLQDAFRMAFRDELTGLPGRRALNERLAALPRRYAVAMLDVDHFKKFNDEHGHDVGDQVLKMVATRIRRVGGGGLAFRYGGEEFTVVFPGKSVQDALPHLEALREAVAGHALALRAKDRPRQAASGRRRRGSRGAAGAVSVTVSIGVAERDQRRPTPQAVLEAADKALYRAKRGGRNRVSR